MPSRKRFLACIRYPESLVLQGAPWMGVAFSAGGIAGPGVASLSLFAFASFLLVAHTFALNDWADIVHDSGDADKSAGIFLAKGLQPDDARNLWIGLGASSLALFALLPGRTFRLAAAITALGFAYSLRAKSIPVFSTAVHLGGGVLHFLLGYSLLVAVDTRGVAIALFFALTFAAGHLNQEVRDHEGDRRSGVRTNAVRFGRDRIFVAGQVLFGLAYGHLALLAWLGLVARPLGFLALLYPIHLLAASRTVRAGLDFDTVSRFQTLYRVLYAGIGFAIILSLVLR